jgi:hypothetical protein
MPDLLEQASDWLDGMRQAHLSRPVTYRRGEDSIEVAATVGKTVFEIDDGYGAIERFESRDFLITAADLALNGEPFEPQPGDLIAETASDKTLVYEVLAPGKEPCWRWSDPHRRTMRIHAKQVDSGGS